MRIGALARQSGCGVETIRYYEHIGLLTPPARNDSNYRVYGPPHLERLLFIRHCRSLDMSLEEIRALLALREAPRQGCQEVNALLAQHLADIDQRIAALSHLRERLDGLRQQCQGEHALAECGIIQGLSACSACEGPQAHGNAASLAAEHGKRPMPSQ